MASSMASMKSELRRVRIAHVHNSPRRHRREAVTILDQAGLCRAVGRHVDQQSYHLDRVVIVRKITLHVTMVVDVRGLAIENQFRESK
jgi:hypothetical protein